MKKHIRIRPITCEEKRNGSPYWTWISNRHRTNESMTWFTELDEPAEANLDVLSEDKTLWKEDEEVEYQETQKRKKLKSALRRALNKLTNTDRDIVTIMSHGCHNISVIAEML